MNLVEKLTIAIDRNIAVYDVDAYPGYLSAKLISLLDISLRQYKDPTDQTLNYYNSINILNTESKLHTIIVDKEIEFGYDVHRALTLRQNTDLIKVEFADFNLTNYYKYQLSCVIPFGKNTIFIAVAEVSRYKKPPKEEYMIGAC